ncbi:MarR family transcriptional regulator [Eubacteriaceae bacterium ES3]|nr:MarR family transcriptional regulator [Eubacteriaceae bacterium ES3]
MSNDCNNSEKSIGKWISLLHRQFQIYINHVLSPYQINSSEYIYIMNLTEESSINQKSLSEKIIVDEAATTRALKRLEAKGYILRERDALDKRLYRVRLSSEGAEIKPFIQQKLDFWTAKLSQNMNESEIDKMITTLKHMSDYAVSTAKGAKNE